ncbi:hypothetical protein HMPREF9246_1394 [Anaerococcus hydrogenalis ACS-025-V-Sch4]|uniref:Uncharacterized protein n=2 Tax=Anaerococcus hydrogenalis TaxID=33029 RepID=F0H234_9FIRM|nr:hypothetical protein HMPREF9246_1394 [Anaerococcus hydrogenalis ACS-025-V-Sch4]PMC81503.1 hypothetical protein CJ192_05605 [Anaerococcus hydrogenalis]
MILFLFSSCKEKSNHHYPLEIGESIQTKEKNQKKEFQIDGYYLVKRDCFMYEKINPLKKWDKIKKKSSVKILSIENENFVKVDYFGNQAFMKKEDLDIDS